MSTEQESPKAELDTAKEDGLAQEAAINDVGAIDANALQQALTEQLDKYVRLQAELENIRRRAERDVSAAHRYGAEKLVKELLAVVDSLERGLDLKHELDEAGKAMHEGMEMTLKLLLSALDKQGVKPVNPEGAPFKAAEMEAISAVPNDKVEPNTVLTVVQKGYYLNDRLIRPALVVVSAS